MSLVLRSTGTSISFYLTPGKKFTAFIDEAKQFESVPAAKAFVGEGRGTFSVVTMGSKFVAWVNW